MNDPFNWLVIVFVVCAFLALLAIAPLLAWLFIFAWAMFTSS